jgi:uncharacterized protein YjeT (DUF2065 family)
MSDFLLYSIVASVVLTVLVNVLPMLFPKSAQRARDKIADSVEAQMQARKEGDDPAQPQPRVKVFFPWKWMLIGSLVLTVLVNVVAAIAGR